jgi:general secretion pathway protein H
VDTTHDSETRTEGQAYLYFFRGGQTEKASIQLRIGNKDDDEETLTVLVSPITGKVTMKTGSFPFDRTADERSLSERDDKGGNP